MALSQTNLNNLSAYELQRLKTMAANNAMLKSLNIEPLTPAKSANDLIGRVARVSNGSNLTPLQLMQELQRMTHSRSNEAVKFKRVNKGDLISHMERRKYDMEQKRRLEAQRAAMLERARQEAEDDPDWEEGKDDKKKKSKPDPKKKSPTSKPKKAIVKKKKTKGPKWMKISKDGMCKTPGCEQKQYHLGPCGCIGGGKQTTLLDAKSRITRAPPSKSYSDMREQDIMRVYRKEKKDARVCFGRKASSSCQFRPETKVAVLSRAQRLALKAVGVEDVWVDKGHNWIGKRLRRFFGRKKYGADGTIVKWLPPSSVGDPALFHMVHDDGTRYTHGISADLHTLTPPAPSHSPIPHNCPSPSHPPLLLPSPCPAQVTRRTLRRTR